ncbi:sodium-dependent multivitamin transporter-like isoform X2 [Pecten maximus]|uniref:sodium-dependent multivitamin transporter-like isoform X2 n=1 Tax=Pecten maximus TaxID=6579 RepID=UPI00145868A6|nr:sodium-dependent multivitamin transporter-like isoform X2 [Pecten maximus]
MGITLYAPALALQTVVGTPLWLSIAVIGLVCTIYTAIGGIKSVVWTDVFQCLIMFIGVVAVIIKGSIVVGTRHSVIRVATEGHRLEWFNFDPDPRVRHTNWGFLFGALFAFLPNWCNQAGVQRFSSLRSLESAYRTFWLLIPVAVAYHIILGYFGILIYSYYNMLGCDPVQAGLISNFNQIVPYFVLDVLRSLPGLSGIFISCLFSGSLSSFSSGINALSANTVEDIFGGLIQKSKLVSQTFAAKLFVFVYGIAVIGLAYSIISMSGSITQKAGIVVGACGGPLTGIYFLGGMIPKANWIGAIVGSVTAVIFNIWIAFGAEMYGKPPVKLAPNPTIGCFPSNFTETMMEQPMYSYNITLYNVTGHSRTSQDSPLTSDGGFFLYNVSYVWYGFIGFFLTLIIGTVVSLCTGGDRGEPVDARLIFPVCRRLCGIQPCSHDGAQILLIYFQSDW